MAQVFHALGKLPGPLIKWFLQELDNEGLCRLLDNYSDRSATASVLFGCYDGARLSTFTAEAAGSIAEQPREIEVLAGTPFLCLQDTVKRGVKCQRKNKLKLLCGVLL